MMHITYSNLGANLVRHCLKEPYGSEALIREKVHFSVSQWLEGKPQKPKCAEATFAVNCLINHFTTRSIKDLVIASSGLALTCGVCSNEVSPVSFYRGRGHLHTYNRVVHVAMQGVGPSPSAT